ECGFCGTAVPLAEARHDDAATGSGSARTRRAAGTAEQRRFPRLPAKGRKLKLLVDGSPTSFAIHNISEGGVMGDHVGDLTPGAPYVGDVALKGDKIVYVGSHAPGRAARTIDATGKAVSPGFINMLSWAVESLIADGRGMSDTYQGVTLEVFGEGDSMGPLTP